jgi:hypothetical protein
MKRAKPAGMFCGVAAAVLVALSSSANAQRPPAEGCRRASQVEYDSAKREYLLRNKFGAYVRIGHIWRRYYWYCRL